MLKKPWTSVAEPYPKAFADMIALACRSQIGWTKKKLNIAGCCRASSLRVGEATNPGPRMNRGARNFSLESAPVLKNSS